MLLVSFVPPDDSRGYRPRNASANKSEQATVGIHPHLPALTFRSGIKSAVRSVVFVFIDRFPEVIGRVQVGWLASLLRLKARFAKIPVSESRKNLIALYYDDGGQTNEELPSIVVDNVGDSIRNHFGLKNRGYGLRLVGKATLDPAELRRVDRRKLHHCDFDIAFIM